MLFKSLAALATVMIAFFILVAGQGSPESILGAVVVGVFATVVAKHLEP